MNQRTLSGLDSHSWFDYWHTHPDWSCKGNKHAENRAAATVLGYELLQEAERRLSIRTEPAQCWATFCSNTRDNGVYIHTHNPNGSPFPYDFSGCEWNSTENDSLNTLVDLTRYRIGKMAFESESYFVVAPLTAGQG